MSLVRALTLTSTAAGLGCGDGHRLSGAASTHRRALSLRRAWIAFATSACATASEYQWGNGLVRVSSETEESGHEEEGSTKGGMARTLQGDEEVDLAQQQRVLGLDELHLGDPGSSFAAAAGISLGDAEDHDLT